ncbi:DUF456 domain-containing protein [Candidatus Contubernalis alkaliaceticus]|uniref:DUF456 domain-containing protein n=1 Tax=Candidatus Contubernalis alkaliaceticus TaxID=338645 RepID=UPI001F4C288F|nr:DUF456 family protein [Candidatus Contubernalis alkalaceticus]UNC92366.1 DUF456 family protein [Candidatus Contubernalis alkalaceticus]
MSITGLITALVIFILGFLGTILPALPGPILIWAGMLVYGFFVDFNNLPVMFYVSQALVVGLIYLIDYFSVVLGAKKYGGSKFAGWGAAAGILVGLFTLGPLGVIVGPFAGAVLVEVVRGRTAQEAIKVGIGTLLGFLGGTFIKLLIEGVMVIWFLIKIF